MFLLDEEISLANIRDAIRKINSMLAGGSDEINLLDWVRRKVLELNPLINCIIQGGYYEGAIWSVELQLTRMGRENQEEWPRLVDGLNEIYKFLKLWWSN